MAVDKNKIETEVSAVLTVDTTLLNKTIDGLANKITTSFSTAALKSVEGFTKKLKEKIQFAFDDTVIGSLKSPIKIKLDIKDANAQVDTLAKKLKDVGRILTKAERAINQATSSTSTGKKGKKELTSDELANRKKAQAELFASRDTLLQNQIEKIALESNAGIKKARENALKEAIKVGKSLSLPKPDENGLFSDASIAKLEKNIEKQRQLFLKAILDERKTQSDQKKILADSKAEESRLRGIFNSSEVNKSKKALDSLNTELDKTIQTITKSGVPITTATKQTSSYDRSIINLRRDLEIIDKEYKDGNITLKEAVKRYESVNAAIRKLGVGINQIDTGRIKKAFSLEEADPRSLGIRFAGLGFTIGAVSNALLNFSRNFFQVFSQLAQVAEPIERVSNSLDLLVKNGKLTAEQKATTLKELRDIGDLPGSSVESANKTFEQLKRINLTLTERLALTRGLAKLPALTGGDPADANQLANALTKASSKGKFEGENFSTLLAQGGEPVQKLLESLGLGTADDINEFGVSKFIRILAKDLADLEVPARTTTDRFNQLKSRFSEFGVIFGTIVAPGLDKLNLFLRDTLEPLLKRLGESFKQLPQGSQQFISNLIIGIPIVIGLVGSLLAVLVTLNFSISSIVQGLKLIPILKGKLGISAAGAVAKTAGTAAAAAPLTGFAAYAAKDAAIAASVAGGGASVGVLAKVTGFLGTILKFLPKILGFTNPIGIAINLLLSSVFAFFSNFNGVKDRLLFAFTKLDAPINRILKILGLEEGGLGAVLGYIGKSILFIVDGISGLFSTVGGVVVEALTAIIDTIGDVINSIANIFDSLKNGEFLSAFGSFLRLLYDVTLGVFVNFGINLAALIVDAIASAIESTIGEGILAGILRTLSNNIRSANGTDIASVNADTLARKQKQNEKELQNLKLKNQEELNQQAEANEKDRIDKLKAANLEIIALLKKSKEEFAKFQIDQKIANLKGNKEELSQKTQDIRDFGKRGLELSTTKGDTSLISSLIQQRLDQTKKERIDIENTIGNLEAAGVINRLLSKDGALKPFYEAVEKGSTELKPLVDILDKVRNSSSIAEALKILKETVPVASRLETASKISLGVDAKTGQRLNLSGLEDKFKNIVAEADLEVAKKKAEIIKIENQAKKDQKELNDQVNSTNEQIRLAEAARENDRKKYLEDQKRLIEDINIEVEKEARTQSQVLDEVNALNDAIREGKKDRERQNTDLLQGLNKEIEEIDAFRDAKRKEIIDDTFLSDEDEKTLLKILDNTTNKKLTDLKKEREERIKGFNELENAYDKLNAKKGNSLLVKFYKDIYDQLRNIANLSVDTLSKFGDTIAKFSNAFKSSGGTSNIKDVQVLKDELQRLVKNEGLSELSSGYLELKDIIFSVENNTFDLGVATEKFIKILGKLRSQPEIDAFNQQLIDTNIALANATTTASRRFIGPDQENNNDRDIKLRQGAPTTRAGVAKIVADFIPSDKSGGQILAQVSEFLKNNETLTIDLKDELKKIVDTANPEELNAGFFDSILELLVRVSGTSEESFKEFVQKALGYNVNQALAIKESIKLYQARLNRDAAITRNEIEETLKQLEKKQADDILLQNQNIDEADKSLRQLDNNSRFASSSELQRIRKQQAAIKVQLIDFNFQKLDIEEAYNIQKRIVQANGNKAEIAQIVKDGTERRKALLEERNKDIIAIVQETGGGTDKFGNPVDANGNPIRISSPTVLKNTGNKESEKIANGTAPINVLPELTKTESLVSVLKSITDDLDGIGNAARKAGNGVLELFSRLASGEGVMNVFRDAIGAMKFDLQSLTEVFAATAEFGIAAFADSLGKAVADTLVNGGNFLKNLGKFFGDTLIMLGTQLLQIGIAAAVLATLGTFFPVLRPLTGGPEGFYAAGVASALGVGMILLGKAMGGGGGSTAAAASTSNTGASNAANSSAGNSGQVDYDPEKDPKLIYQKALRTEVYIDIKRDDGSIVKSIVRQVNRNPAFANLIGNGRTGFVL